MAFTDEQLVALDERNQQHAARDAVREQTPEWTAGEAASVVERTAAAAADEAYAVEYIADVESRFLDIGDVLSYPQERADIMRFALSVEGDARIHPGLTALLNIAELSEVAGDLARWVADDAAKAKERHENHIVRLAAARERIAAKTAAAALAAVQVKEQAVSETPVTKKFKVFRKITSIREDAAIVEAPSKWHALDIAHEGKLEWGEFSPMEEDESEITDAIDMDDMKSPTDRFERERQDLIDAVVAK